MSGSLFSISPEDSHEVLKTVLPLMSRHRVPTIPQNYSVWYDYVARSKPGLVKEIDERISSGLAFPPEFCEQIHERYFVDPIREQVSEIQAGMREAMGVVLQELQGLDDGLGEFGSVLADTGESLSGDPSREQLLALVSRLVEHTRATQARSARTEASLQTMARQVEELRLEVDALSRDATVDALTGVPNRRAFEEGLRRMSREAEASGQSLCLLLADVDRFKHLNDTYGHVVGDQVLCFIAQEINQCVKGRDLLCRYGGEEFAVLLPATSYEGAIVLAESIRAIIEAQVTPLDDGTLLENLTVSIGVAQYRPGEERRGFVNRADLCMYQCKADGRNRVIGERDMRAAEAG